VPVQAVRHKNMESTKLLKDYYKAKLELSLAQENVKILGEELTKFLANRDDRRAEIPEAKFTLRTTTSYRFSKAVEKQEEKIKAIQESIEEKLRMNKEILKSMQEEEIAGGVAEKISESFVPVMTPVKEK